jgi:hypothetical protein
MHAARGPRSSAWAKEVCSQSHEGVVAVHTAIRSFIIHDEGRPSRPTFQRRAGSAHLRVFSVDI